MNSNSYSYCLVNFGLKVFKGVIESPSQRDRHRGKSRKDISPLFCQGVVDPRDASWPVSLLGQQLLAIASNVKGSG